MPSITFKVTSVSAVDLDDPTGRMTYYMPSVHAMDFSSLFGSP